MGVSSSVTDTVWEYLLDLYNHGLCGRYSKSDIRSMVNKFLRKGLPESQVLKAIKNEHKYLVDGDILLYNNDAYIVNEEIKAISKISMEEVMSLLGHRFRDKDGDIADISDTRKSFRGIYIDGVSLYSSGYRTVKIICTHRRSPVQTVCTIDLFSSTEKVRNFLEDGLPIVNIRRRIYRKVSESGLTPELDRLLIDIKNYSSIEGMEDALRIIGSGPKVIFSKYNDSTTSRFDFIDVEFGLVYNDRTYKEQVEYLKRCIKAFDLLAEEAAKKKPQFKRARAKISNFKIEKILTRQNVLWYKFSLR